MPIDILMPALSPTMEEGTLAKWHVKEGDKVEPGDVIAEIETDKATMEVEAVDEGTVGKILISEGTEGVKVNEKIALLLGEDEDESALKSESKSNGSSKAASGGSESSGDAPKTEEKSAKEEKSSKESKPSQETKPESAASDNTQAAGQGSKAPAPKTEGRIIASPLAKRMAEQAGLDIGTISGSGPNGRIVKADVEAAISGGGAKPADGTSEAPASKQAPAQVQAPAQMPSPEQLGLAPGSYDEEPLSNMRRTIAQRLTTAKRDVPHYYLTVDIEVDALLKLRKELNDKSPEGEGAYKISVNDFVIRACALALKRCPDVNSSWAEDKILRHKNADVAMAVAIDGGLITPIIRAAETKGLAGIAQEAKDLATRARTKKLKPEEYQGGTFSISNLGMFGIKNFTGVINPPHAAILAVGAGEQRPVVKDGALQIATVMTCTLSCDHRVLDGAEGSKFLDYVKSYLQDPVTMLL